MKTRQRTHATPAAARRHPATFTLHPLSVACLVALAGPAFALPTGGTVVNGQATIVKPTPSLQVVTQGTQKAVIDWTTFSIAAGETVRFDQPSSSAVLLNRVTGYDPSAIFGQMQSNGRIFLLNPYGVVFGASARVDVGGLVASSLSLSSADFMAGRFSLSSSGDAAAPARRGEVRNEGTISAPGGVVVLAGPVVSNTGTIEAAGGRVGLAAAQEALVDVEGDGLIFFRTTGTEAGNRLAQLGRIQADGGSVELRAAARGAFADTVLNMGGVVQARSLGVKEGRVVIDGGAEGRTNVAGTIDTSSVDGRGGDVAVAGQSVVLQNGTSIDASGATGGGSIRLGGGYQGHDDTIRNAEVTAVGAGAVLKADATVSGDGGKVIVWSDGRTLFAGDARVRGGPHGGNGGFVETSGKGVLTLEGSVDASAPMGRLGTWLLDPFNIDVVANGADDNAVELTHGTGSFWVDHFADPTYSGTPAPKTANTSSIDVAKLIGASIELQATNDITFSTPLTLGSGATLTARAGHDVIVNSPIDVAVGIATVTLSANDPTPGSTANGTGRVEVKADIAAGGTLTIDNHGASRANLLQGQLQADTVTVNGATVLTGATAVGVNTLAHFSGTVDATTAGGQSLTLVGAAQLDGAVGNSTPLSTLFANGAVHFGGGAVRSTGAQTFGGTLSLTADATLAGGAINLNAATTSLAAGANSIAIETDNLTLAGAVTSTGAGTARLGAAAAATTLGVAGGAGTASFTQAEIDGFAPFASLTLGRGDGTGTVTLGAVTLPQNTTVLANNAAITFTGAITGGANTLRTTTSGTTTLQAAASTTNLASLTIDGPANIQAPTVDTTLGQTYTGSVTLGADTTLTAGAAGVGFGGSVDGAHTLAVTTGGTTTFGGVVGGGTALTSLTVSGAVQANTTGITTTATQTYGDTVTLGANATFTGPALIFNGNPTAIAALGHDLSLRTNALTLPHAVTSSGAGTATLAAATAGGTLGIATLTATDASYSAGDLASFGQFGTLQFGRGDGSGTITLGALTLSTDTSVVGQTAAINLAGAVTGGNHALTTNTGGTTTIGANLNGLSSLTITGAAQLNTASVTTSGNQTYGGTLTLSAPTTLAGAAIRLNASGTALAAGANDLSVQTHGLVVAGDSTGGGTLHVSGLANGDTIGIGSTATTDLSISQATLAHLGSFGSVEIGSATTGAITIGNLTLGTALVVTGAATVEGAVLTTAGQTYNGTVTLGANGTFTGATLAFNDAGTSIAAGGHDLAIQTHTLTLASPITSTGAGAARLGGFAAADTLGIGTAGTTSYLQSQLDSFAGFASLTLGRSDGTGAVTVGDITLHQATAVIAQNAPIGITGAVTGNGQALSTNSGGTTTIAASASFANLGSLAVSGQTLLDRSVATSGAQTYTDTVTLGGDTTLDGSTLTLGAVTGAHALVLNPTGTANLNGAVAVASVNVNGATTIGGGSVTTTGAQTYNGPVTLNANTTLGGAGVAVTGALNAATNGGQSLTINATGATTLAAVGTTTRLSSLHTDAAGTTTLGGDVTTSGGQIYDDAVTLGVNVTATGSSVAFNNTVNALAAGAQSLTVNAAGATVFGAPVGAAQALGALTTNAGGSTTLAGNVSTVGATSFGDAVILAGDSTVAAGSVSFNSTVDGAHALVVNSPGVTQFGAAVGGGTRLLSLTTDAGGSTTLAGSVFTTNAQNYGDGLVLNGNVTLDASSISLVGPNIGAFDLLLQYDTTFTRTGTAAGTGFVSLAPRNAASTIGIGLGAPGTFQADLTQLAGLPNFGVGRPDGTGLVSVGSLTLSTDFRVQSGTGDVQFIAPVAGAGHALNVRTDGTTTVGATLSSLSALTVGGSSSAGAGTTALTAGATIDASGAQTYSNAVTLSGTTTLNAGTVAFDGPVGGNASLIVNGATTIAGGSVTTTGGTQTYNGALALVGATTLNGNAVTFASPVTGNAGLTVNGSTTIAGGSVTLASGAQTYNGALNLLAATTLTAANVTLGGPVLGSASLTVDGSATLGNSVVTSGAQTYNGAVALTGPVTLGASAVDFAGTVDGGQSLTVSASGSTTFGGAVGAGTALASLTVVNAAQLGAGSIRTSGAQTYGGDVSLGVDTTLTAASVGFGGRVNGAHALNVAATGTTTFGAAVGDAAQLGSLSVANAARINGGRVATTGAQQYGGAVTLGATTALDAASVAFASTLDGAGALTLRSAGNAGFAGAIGATTRLATIDVAAGSIQLAANAATTGAQTWTGPMALGGDVALVAGAGVVLAGSVDGAGPARNLTVTAPNTTLRGAVGAVQALGGLTINGAAELDAVVNTTGAQTYAGAAQLGADLTLNGSAVRFAGTLDGAHSLVVNAADTRFEAAVGATAALTGLSTDAAGTTRVAAGVTTSGAQHYGDALLLTGPTTLNAGTLQMDGAVDGAQSLSATTSGGTSLGAPVGATTALASLSIAGPVALHGVSVQTTGSQSYAGAVTLGGDVQLSGNGVAFGAGVDGAHALTVQSTGGTSFGANVGATNALAALAVDGGTITLNGASIETTGLQHYGAALNVNGSARLTGGALDLAGGLTGASDLLLQADTLSAGGALVGTGTLSIEPLTSSRTIGVAGGAGDLRITQALLSGASSFVAQRIGRTDGSGDIDAGALSLAADTTIQTGSGNLTLHGNVDGAFALALDSGGTTRIDASIGTTTALRSLTTDNNAGATDWNGTSGEHTLIDTAGGARIVTTGAQTYNDPLLATTAVQLNGSTITATQAGNRFDGLVQSVATQLDLHSSSALMLGDVTLGGGGRIESDTTVELAGALHLNGGTLSLVAKGQPTALADFTDPELAGQGGRLNSGAREASATIFESQAGTVATAAGSLLVLRSPGGGSILLNNEPDASHPGRQNQLIGDISAVSGTLGGTTTSDTLGFVRITSTEIHAAGAPPADGSQSLLAAGIEGDVLRLSADKITTGAAGQLRARLPYSNVLGARDSIPGLTLIMSPTALTIGGGFGLATPDGYIQVRVGDALGGYVTVRPRGATGENAFILLAGPEPRPFYDLNGKADEVRLFYNGDAPRTPQETGALSALMAIVEDARQTRFEEAVRTENVKSRLRSGVIAEVGAGRPATVGRESIRLPSSCNPKDTTLQCE